MQIDELGENIPGLVTTKRGVRIVGASQYIRYAYCVQAKETLDIYEAQNAYFEQAEPRKPFRFLCPDDACRAALSAKITAVNYNKIVSDEDIAKKAPHYRWNPNDDHLVECALVARYIARMAAPSPALRKKTKPQSEDEIPVVETFEIRDAEAEAEAEPLDEQATPPIRGLLPRPAYTHRIEREAPNSTVLLQPVVESYHRLCGERLAGETMLTIGERPRSYLGWFKRVQEYALLGERVYHGGARVKRGLKGAWFVEFMDSVTIDDVTDRPTLVIRNAEIQAYSRRGILRAILAAVEGTKAAYARCYFFGVFAVVGGRIRADFGSDLSRVYAAPRNLKS